MTKALVELAICAAIILVAIPLTLYAVRFVKTQRRLASAAAALLCLIGIGIRIDPPPPQTTEAREHEEKDEEI